MPEAATDSPDCGERDRKPFIPALARNAAFTGRQLHTVNYRKPQDFTGQRVAVVGAGNSGAQIAADLAGPAAQVRWMTARTPRFLPDDIGGRVCSSWPTGVIAR